MLSRNLGERVVLQSARRAAIRERQTLQGASVPMETDIDAVDDDTAAAVRETQTLEDVVDPPERDTETVGADTRVELSIQSGVDHSDGLGHTSQSSIETYQSLVQIELHLMSDHTDDPVVQSTGESGQGDQGIEMLEEYLRGDRARQTGEHLQTGAERVVEQVQTYPDSYRTTLGLSLRANN